MLAFNRVEDTCAMSYDSHVIFIDLVNVISPTDHDRGPNNATAINNLVSIKH